MNDFEKLTHLSNRLKSLTEDPQEGLMTWNTMLQETLQELTNLLNKKGFVPKFD
jgi:hypothetical protein